FTITMDNYTAPVLNNPPSKPMLYSPLNASEIDNPKPILVWNASRDDDGDAMLYQLGLSQSSDFTSLYQWYGINNETKPYADRVTIIIE
ncbi:hypothetical protein COT48_05955, partial [Candidatus Woesearchaeota archaeon CG08_land_8_20_14_0_20_47_9]